MNEEATGAQQRRAERATAALYRRFGSRIVLLCIGGALVLAVLTGVDALLVVNRYLPAPIGRVLPIYGFWMAMALVVSLIVLRTTLGQIRTVLSWPREGRVAAIDTWYAIVRIQPMVGRCTGAAGVLLLPASIHYLAEFDKPWYAVIPLFIGLVVVLASASALIVFTAELVMRPMLEDVAAQLPPDFDPRPQGMQLGIKALAPLPFVTMFAALNVGAYANVTNNGAERLSLAMGMAVVTIGAATIVFLIIQRSVLSPIDDLLDATERVGRGDITTPVPLLSADELGRLAYRFNRMLADLRQHASDLEASRARVVAAADAERQRIERDLHDGAQQRLVLLNLKLRTARRAMETGPAAAALLDELSAEADRALVELRDLAHGVYPAVLESDGVPAALAEAAEHAAIPTAITTDAAGRYPPEIEAAIYFCCLEALQNAAKHAGAGARATVSLSECERTLRFEVADDGAGFDPAARPGSAGVQNMTDRIGALGGMLELRSAPGAGTTVAGVVPVYRHV